MSSLVRAARAGDLARALELQLKLNPLHRLLFIEANPIPVKWALHLMGLMGPELRLPLTPLAEATRPALEAELARLGLVAPGVSRLRSRWPSSRCARAGWAGAGAARAADARPRAHRRHGAWHRGPAAARRRRPRAWAAELRVAAHWRAGSAVDVVVDFTVAESVEVHARACAEAGVAWVLGTTGLDEDAQAAVAAASRQIPVVVAPNMLRRAYFVLERRAEQASRALGEDFDVEVLEIASPHEEGRAQRDRAAAGRGGLAQARGASGRPGAPSARGSSARGPRARSACRPCAAATWWASTPCSSSARASGWSSPTGRPAGTPSPRGALRAARWLAGQAPGLYDLRRRAGPLSRRADTLSLPQCAPAL